MMAQRNPSPHMIRRAAAMVLRARARGPWHTYHPTAAVTTAAPAPPRQPLPHEIPLSAEEVRFAIAKSICREPRDCELPGFISVSQPAQHHLLPTQAERQRISQAYPHADTLLLEVPPNAPYFPGAAQLSVGQAMLPSGAVVQKLTHRLPG